jgi:trehalose 6-phosphate synthase
MWSKESLIEMIGEKLKGYKFIVASNREPYIHEYKGREIKCIKAIGGLTLALDSVMEAVGGLWVAHGSGDADKEVVDENDCIRIPPDRPAYTLKRIWLTKEEEDGYYYGYANQALWPLSHIVYEKPIFLAKHWQMYKRVNQYFAEAILKEVGDDKAFVWLQDYHLALVAKYIKEKRPDITVSIFWHIPWPNPEAFRICPQKKEILEGLLSCDLLGFHINYHCINFMNTIDFELEAKSNYPENSVTYKEHKTFIKPFPISVDIESISKAAQSKEVQESMKELPNQIPPSYEILAVSVDRIDYTKGIIEKLRAIERFLKRYPKYHGKFVFYQALALSRMHIRSYESLLAKIHQVTEEINWEYKKGNWYPIVLVSRRLDYAEHLALYRSANLCIVSSLHDGMNLVAKEFLAANDGNDSILLLSRFTGASREFEKDAILINPYDYAGTAEAIKRAIEMPKEKKKERMKRMKEIIYKSNIYVWAGNFISELVKL